MFIAQESDFAPPIGRTCCWDAASSPWASAHFGDECVELIERHPHSALHARRQRAFQGFLAREELVQSETRSALALLKGSRHDHIADVGHPLIELGEDQPRGRIHLEVTPRKHLRILWVASKRKAIGASHAQVLLALEERYPEGLRRPPLFQELRFCPRLKDDMRRRI